MCPDRDFGNQTLGAIPQLSKGTGGCTPRGWLCWQHPPVTDGPAPWSRGLPCAAHQLAHLLPCGSWMSPCLHLQGVVRASPSPAASCSTRGCGSSTPTDFIFSICTTQAPAGCASHKGALIISQTRPLTRLSSQSASFADTQFSPPPPPTSSSQPVPSSRHVRLKLLRLFPSHAGTHSPRCCLCTFPSLPVAFLSPSQAGKSG